MANRTCSLDGCERPHEARDLCHMHYERFRRHGRIGPTAPMAVRGPERQRLEAHIEKQPGGCWIWTGGMSADGYGRFRGDDGVTRSAHRVVWAMLVGPIPDGMQLDHHRACPKCCANPAHLRLVSPKQNSENRAGLQRNNKSGHPNVSHDRGKWRVVVTHHGKRVSGGYFDALDDAAQAAHDLRIRLYTHNDIDRTPS